MELRVKSFLLLITMIIFTLISCAKQEKDKAEMLKNKQVSPQLRQGSSSCEGIDCQSSMDWKIFLHGKSFPEKVRLEIDQMIVLDECLSKQRFSVKRFASPQFVYLDEFMVPKNDKLKIKIVDLGNDCDLEDTFVYDESVPFEIEKSTHGHNLIVNL